MSTFSNTEGVLVVDRMILGIRENKQYLSDIDGAIGDGDHGINMNKGFTLTREALDKDPGDFSHGLITLAKILMMRIGGAMGPLYGKIFKTMGKAFAGHEQIDAKLFQTALKGIKEGMSALSPAKVGDKTLVDALYPAIEEFDRAIDSGNDFKGSLEAMKKAAESGRDATEDMVAQLGRSSRLGERSRGVVDAGAVSCALLLGIMADTIIDLIES
jgi:dihydroxyacetone kinase-like protein